ncbi:MAG: glutamate--tRNA ligase [Planctomycetes bacterium]|nr:glutamate--tRNA ligase [Planctomycetota bacterium]
MTRPVRVRIAPSPTGDPHVGTAYIALFNLAFARQHRGKFVLRIEDTDQARSNRDSEEMIFASLRWLGLSWDEGPDVGGPFGPYRQSERTAIYQQHAKTLIESGAAYRCFCTKERLEEMRLDQQRFKRSPGYDGRCRDLPPGEVEALVAERAPFTVRLRAPKEEEVVCQDRLRGAIAFQGREIDDQILLKADGYPTYHLANVVDDHLMEITHVIRAEEWISSTPKHVLLYRAFDWPPPEFIHMPLLRNQDKSKISKRRNPCSLNYYRDAGYLPAALLNFLALQGWSMPPKEDGTEVDRFTLEEFFAHFNIDRVKTGGPVFDLKKLEAINGDHIRRKSVDEIAALLKEHAGRWFEKTAHFLHDRLDKLSDFARYTDFLFRDDLGRDPALLRPYAGDRQETAKRLKTLTEEFEQVVPWKPATITDLLARFVARHGLDRKEFFMLLRVAVTGSTVSPPLDESIAALDRFVVLERLRAAAKTIREMKPAP